MAGYDLNRQPHRAFVRDGISMLGNLKKPLKPLIEDFEGFTYTVISQHSTENFDSK